ncbi:penicillin-insensitive murein endopeptidase [Pseudooceanicola sp. HF7]|uniref:penicillin-insensitive murein endopeptidase n=1 Tax=Pseudooceanicola sp. HF7 TaxID=2721560 RepID=UPI0014301273|nr:penicillin-insensitive murein endopeptidase [Pseudooceanicola sp. HF7]NIZ09703.1 penicillin-insensitive murein endopeptidase [Pseudooceanicola sp. HF7]
MRLHLVLPMLLALLATLAGCGPDKADTPTRAIIPPDMQNKEARQLFGAMSFASAQSPSSYGSYSRGCVAGAEQLAESGPTWQAMRLSRNRNWGTPELIDYLEDLSGKAAKIPGWKGIYIGDMSQPRGGPMTSGHASHQIGLDADIWLRPATDLSLSRSARENISSISMRRNAGAFVNDNWTPQHMELVKAAASDPRVARIFLFPGAKVQMCKEATGDRSWLRKVRPWYGHHYHFHVRLACPRGMSGCVNQDPPPPGDGCAEAQQWVNNILNPPPPDPNAPAPKPRRQLKMADLPAQCLSVLQSR